MFLASFLLLNCSTPKIDRDPNTIQAPFDGKKFDNIEPFPDKSFFTLLKWRWQALFNSISWPDKIENEQFTPAQARSKSLKVYVINHATVLIQIDNLNILTDPHFTKRASPVSWAGPKRVIKPGIALKDLPPIDVVLVSHNHYDHLDLGSLQQLAQLHNPLFYVGLGTKHFLIANGVVGKSASSTHTHSTKSESDNSAPNIIELDWWQEVSLSDIKFTFVPAQHWSARGLSDRREMLWGGFYIRGSQTIYFAGDTGYGSFFNLIREKMGSPNLAILPIGAYEPRWFMKNAHVNPEEAVKGFIDLKAKKAMAIHFGTFKLTDEGIDDPTKDLGIALKKYQLTENDFIVPVFGKEYAL